MSKMTRVQTTGVLIEVKDRAEEEAKKQGFGNLQDAVRLFITQLAEGKVQVGGFAPQSREFVTPEMHRQYQRDLEELERDIASGKAKEYDSVEELMDDLQKD